MWSLHYPEHPTPPTELDNEQRHQPTIYHLTKGASQGTTQGTPPNFPEPTVTNQPPETDLGKNFTLQELKKWDDWDDWDD